MLSTITARLGGAPRDVAARPAARRPTAERRGASALPATRALTPLAPILAATLAALIVAWTPAVFGDGDTFLHVAAGLRMLAAHAVLTTDPFSFTFAGHPWQTHEWLSEVLMALAWRAAGWSGVALLSAAAFGATAGLMTRHAGRWLRGLPLAAAVAMGLATLAPSLLARPHLLALPLLEMWLAELLFARADGRMPDVRRLAPLMIAWANIHASFLFGIGLAGAFGLEAVLRQWLGPECASLDERLRTIVRWAALGLALAAAACIGPHGVDTLLFPLRLTPTPALARVDEWRPMVLAAHPTFEAVLLGGAAVLIALRARVPALTLALLMLLAWMALGHVRHVLLFGVAAPLLVAEPLGRALAARDRARRGAAQAPNDSAQDDLAQNDLAPDHQTPCHPVADRPRINLITAALALAALALVVAPRLAAPLRIADTATTPVSALAHVPAELLGQPVLNAYPFGGYLAFAGGAPFVDSRVELYGDGFLQAYGRLDAGEPAAIAATLADRRIRWTLLQPDTPLATALDAAPGWRRLYADRFAVVHVRVG